MNIVIGRDGSAVTIKSTINVPGSGDVVYTAQIDVGNQYYAGFVAEAIRDQFGDGLSAMRKEAYERGWQAAKAKKAAKETWFSNWWKS